MTISCTQFTEDGRNMTWTAPPRVGPLLQRLEFSADEPAAQGLLAQPVLRGPWSPLVETEPPPATLLRALGEVPEQLQRFAPQLHEGEEQGRPRYELWVMDPNNLEGETLSRPVFRCMDCTEAAVWCDVHRVNAEDGTLTGVLVSFFLMGQRFPIGDHAPSAD